MVYPKILEKVFSFFEKPSTGLYELVEETNRIKIN